MTLDEEYRNGGALIENREGGTRDLCGDFRLCEKRPDILRNDLERMGVTEDGDEPIDDVE